MHRANNAVIMQTEQLGRIEALEEELQSSRAKMVELEQKLTEQDRIIAQLVGDNLDHLQDSMCLTAHCHRTIFFTRIFVHFTGDKGLITQWVHAEFMVGSETIRPTFTQWVRGGYFSKVPTKVPTG